jgi:hypothetical protein
MQKSEAANVSDGSMLSKKGSTGVANTNSGLALLWQIFAADERDGIERSR